MRDVVVKGAMAVLGGVAQALLVDATSPPMGRRQKLASRLKLLPVEAVIGDALGEELLWLWEVRNWQHLHELNAPAFALYTANDHPHAEAAVAQLIVALKGRLPAATRAPKCRRHASSRCSEDSRGGCWLSARFLA